MKYTPVIGLEIHLELNTKTKMFCACSAEYFGKKPNTQVCPVCLGLPGALPFVNEEALKKCMMVGLALNCQISEESRFERKNYFYPDLPKGYQISQYRWPLCTNGYLEINGKKIRVNRVHQEEDTAKLAHQLKNPNDPLRKSDSEASKIQMTNRETGIDFNRSSVPLVEIVTEPDFDNVADVIQFAKQVHQIVRDLDVSNADMERGDFRLEANISLRTTEQVTSNTLPDYRVELKNINSFRFMQHAIEYEFARQEKALDAGEKLIQETRGWNEQKGQTYSQREKEEAHDYRYFPDPDLPVLMFTEEYIDNVRKEIPDLFGEKISKLANKYNVPEKSVETLFRKGLSEYYEAAMETANGVDPSEMLNVIINGRAPIDKIVSSELSKYILSLKEKNISENDLNKAIDEVISTNSKVVDDYKSGKVVALQFLIGQVMKTTRGQASPESVKKLLEEKLK